METELLATKVRIPPPSTHTVHRARLVNALEAGTPRHKLILLSAPAGYGKTTLLAQWAQASRFEIAWLSLSAEDNDLERFLRYLLAAWQQVQPSVMESRLGRLLASMMPDPQAVLSAFINVAADLPDPLVVVLDDYHLITDVAIHQALTFLLDHLPPALHFVLAGRAEPPLPLPRYLARQELLELRADDLQFQQGETAELLNRQIGLELSEDDLVLLHARLEGWIAGLQLASLSLRRRREAASELAVSGTQRFIADYLSQEVLAELPAASRQFLLRTSILDRLCSSLCDAVTEAAEGQAMLEHLEKENLFLVALDDNREWFRYHQLFAEHLHAELSRRYPDEIARLHRRAGRWYLAHDLPEQAFQHAVIGDDADLAMRILERYMNIMLNSGALTVLTLWLDSLPAPWFAAHPLLVLFRAGLLAFTGAFVASLRDIDEAERRLALAKNADARWQLGIVNAVRCFFACIQNDLSGAERYADQALRDLRDESWSFRASIYHALGDAYRTVGRWDEAHECYRKVLALADVPGFRLQAVVQGVHVSGALADLELRQGHLRNAARFWRQALAAIRERESWGRIELPVIGWVYIRMGEILYEWNDLDEAGSHLAQGLDRAELGGDVRAMIAGYLLAGRLKLTSGDIEAARTYLERLRPLIEHTPFAGWPGRFERFQLECWLAQGKLPTAADWSDQLLRGAAIDSRPESELTWLAIARVLLATGDRPSVERALVLLARLIAAAAAAGRTGVQVEALALHAIAHGRRADWAGAMTALERALRLAEPEGYVRLFADLGRPMARLLQEARSRAVLPAYVEKLLAAFAGDVAFGSGTGAAPPEPLSPREHEILRLIAAGLTNREIAELLVVSPETVKKHTGNIYGKLAVGNRTEAVARARELGVLD